jgi:hypothetical protein
MLSVSVGNSGRPSFVWLLRRLQRVTLAFVVLGAQHSDDMNGRNTSGRDGCLEVLQESEFTAGR